MSTANLVGPWNLPLPFHIDPGHGWVEVTAEQLAAVALRPQDFSRYSYVAGGRSAAPVYYLEEDCDATAFFAACKRVLGIVPPIAERHHNRDAFIRSLPGIQS